MLTALLVGVHQAEEVVLPIRRWLDEAGTTGCGWLDDHLRANPLASTNPWIRAGLVAGQGGGLWVLYRLTRGDRRATRRATTTLVTLWSVAFCMHIGVSLRTRSFMPGTATSILPGIPGAVSVLSRIDALTR